MKKSVTSAGRWPDGSALPFAGNVVIWSGEDDPTDTLVPRLILSEADLSRVYFIADVKEGKERRSFDPAHDMPALRHWLYPEPCLMTHHFLRLACIGLSSQTPDSHGTVFTLGI
ncbi:hypothetical protein GCM10027046_09330 [Uliginosibacterium flavum]|uniref:Uncharacterized protein n=1 Tax=Uliginosibacterium flavum TaxID=1396831 RepID=A0ABV2TIA7_9RHOO